MADLGTLSAKVNADTKDFRRGMSRAEGRLENLGDQANQTQTQLGGMDSKMGDTGSAAASLGQSIKGGLIGGGLALAGDMALEVAGDVARMGKEFVNTAGDIERNADAAGTGVKEWQKLKFAFKKAGLQGDDLKDVLGTLSERAFDAKKGAQGVQEDFSSIGVSVDDLEGKNPAQLFEEVAEGIKTTESKTKSAKAAVSLFGDEIGNKLLTRLKEGEDGLTSFIDKAGKAGIVLDKQTVQQAQKAQKAWKNLKTQFQAVKRQIFAALLPAFEAISDAVAGTINFINRLELSSAFDTSPISDFRDELEEDTDEKEENAEAASKAADKTERLADKDEKLAESADEAARKQKKLNDRLRNLNDLSVEEQSKTFGDIQSKVTDFEFALSDVNSRIESTRKRLEGVGVSIEPGEALPSGADLAGAPGEAGKLVDKLRALRESRSVLEEKRDKALKQQKKFNSKTEDLSVKQRELLRADRLSAKIAKTKNKRKKLELKRRKKMAEIAAREDLPTERKLAKQAEARAKFQKKINKLQDDREKKAKSKAAGVAEGVAGQAEGTAEDESDRRKAQKKRNRQAKKRLKKLRLQNKLKSKQTKKQRLLLKFKRQAQKIRNKDIKDSLKQKQLEQLSVKFNRKLKNLKREQRETEKTLNEKTAQTASSAQSLVSASGGAVSNIASAAGAAGGLQNALNGAFSAMSGIAGAAAQFASGNIVGGIAGLIGTVGSVAGAASQGRGGTKQRAPSRSKRDQKKFANIIAERLSEEMKDVIPDQRKIVIEGRAPGEPGQMQQDLVDMMIDEFQQREGTPNI